MFAYDLSSTIVALATPPGQGALAIIRLSGKEAFSLITPLFDKPLPESHRARLGRICDHEGKTVDQVLLLPMKGPFSFTGEDVVEIHCHGSMLIVKEILDLLRSGGARQAEAGEFSFRAFMHGKLDLAQAESIQNVICAQSRASLKAAQDQLSGSLSLKISQFQHEIADIASIIEAWVDYPEEGLEFASEEEILDGVEKIIAKMRKLAHTFRDGQKMKTGFKLCLLGAPNVGKSSLMNALLGKERAIVTEIAGTTRDILEESLHFGGLHFHLYDTAGIRQSVDIIEKEGIERAKKMANEADLVLFLLDLSRPINEEERSLLQTLDEKKRCLIWNKCDLNANPSRKEGLCISAKCGLGIDHLKEAICARVMSDETILKEEWILTEARHYEALTLAIEDLSRFVQGMKESLSPECLASDLRSALSALGLILGVDVTEEILGALFSKFCVGK